MTAEERDEALAAARLREAEAWGEFMKAKRDHDAAQREYNAASAARISIERDAEEEQ